VATKPKAKSRVSRASRSEDVRETDVFLAALKRHGQVQEDATPLKPGVTHVIERTGAKAKPRLVRKRFSAI
jgi:hypothetical protein